jgi:dsRNA-gated channel SID-1
VYTVRASEIHLLSRKNGIALMLGVAAGIAVLTLLMSPIPQPASYHNFADQRSWLGLTNFLNVISNVPFAIVGLWGIAFVLRSGTANQEQPFVDPRERWPYLAIFAGLVLTAFGSAYYHLAPNNAHLVWDRLPMTIVFGSMVAALITERISVNAGLALLPWLIAFSAASVLEWYWTELRGQGDLRIYAAVQIYSALALLMALLLPAKYTRGHDFAVVFAFYLLAKLFETFDRAIYSAGHVVSGHTLKHLAAAAAGYWILRMLRLREPLARNSSGVNTRVLSSY